MPKRRFKSMAYMEDEKYKVLVIIPAYNESASISYVVELINAHLPANFDLLVIDDGSDDMTGDICRMRGVKVITHVFNMGYGAALKTGYQYASKKGYDIVIQLDADGQHDISNITKLYERLLEDDAPDIVIGSRFLDGAQSFYTPAYKRFVIAWFRFLIKLTSRINITDPTSGLQGIRRTAFTYYARFNKFAIDYPDANMIIQMAMSGYQICEIPAVMHEREFGTSMHSGIIEPILYIIKMLLAVIVVGLRETSRRPKVYYRKPKKRKGV